MDTRTAKHSFDFIQFFSLASVYRDMMVDGLYGNFVLANHTPKRYWLMGCCGSFDILDINLLGKITYPILLLDSRVKPKQFNGCNCGVIWFLFIMNIMKQAHTSYNFNLYKKKDNEE